VGRQIDRDERTESGLDVGDEEDEPVEAALAGARARRRFSAAACRRLRLDADTRERTGCVFER
jgi:hypothetical protein